MMMKFKDFCLLTMLVVAGTCFTACTDEPQNPKGEKQRLILIYAVAANSLEGNLGMDLQEIISVAPDLDLVNNKLLVYSVKKDGICELKELTGYNGNYTYNLVRSFPELPLSTSSERMREVIEFVDQSYDYEKKGLILWSHATGWLYWPQGATPEEGKQKAFGEDIYSGKIYKTNIPELADGIPEGVFDFIWFDCCYSANIETLYQLRYKTDYMIGSVIEISSMGMPYDLTMPYLLRKDADLAGAAFEFYDYYDTYGYPYAVSIIKSSELEGLAEVTREISGLYGEPGSLAGVQNYSILYENSRRTTFYDMRQLLEAYGPLNSDLKKKTDAAFGRAVLYNKISDRNWTNGYVTYPEDIDVSGCSGLSMNNFVDNGTTASEFYRTLDWYKATRE